MTNIRKFVLFVCACGFPAVFAFMYNFSFDVPDAKAVYAQGETMPGNFDYFQTAIESVFDGQLSGIKWEAYGELKSAYNSDVFAAGLTQQNIGQALDYEKLNEPMAFSFNFMKDTFAHLPLDNKALPKSFAVAFNSEITARVIIYKFSDGSALVALEDF